MAAEQTPAQDTAATHNLKPSRFTYRHLQLLRSFSTKTPLRVIAHIDLDAFYAQCEMVRLNMPREVPLAVQQWESLIAINYAARPYNVTRMITATEARKRCPGLVTQHVATFREGEGGRWAYRDDAARRAHTDKVSLDPYRIESRKIMETMRGALADWAERVDQRGPGEKKPGATGWKEYGHMVKFEKASVDETFIDLSYLVYATLLERYPMLHFGDEEKVLSEKLPQPPHEIIEWGVDSCLIDLDDGQDEDDTPDWDDIAISIGAEIVKQVRKAVWDRLSYTCSGGIARNKMISKLGSGCNKPDKQTVVRNRAIQTFLADFKFTKIRMLGGKLGKHISACFDTELVTDLLKVPIDQMRAKLGEETANWLYLVIRGEECSEVNTRVQIKSMLSAKSFRPSIRSIEQAKKWLHIFVADIHNRLVQDGILEHKRRPRVITMHYHSEGKHGASRQMQIPQGKPIDEQFLHTLTKKLLAQTVASAKVFPCFNLSLSVSGFEDGTTGTKSLHGFFTLEEKKEETENTKSETPPVPEATSESVPRKRRKLGPFFTTQSPEQSSGVNSPTLYEEAKSSPALTEYEVPRDSFEEASPFPSFQCSRCGKSVIELDRLEHDDWHLAKDLAEEEERQVAAQSTQQEPRSSGSGFGFARQAPRGRGRVEKGQSRLFFG